VKNAAEKNYTTEELKSKLSKLSSIQLVTVSVFGVILVLWLVLGYWKDNLPIFISTIAMAVTVSSALLTSQLSLRAAIRKRTIELEAAEIKTVDDKISL
jgi:hypothetical protein